MICADPDGHSHPGLLYKENHALDAWFCIAYGDEQKEN